jgi:hypothetical protein
VDEGFFVFITGQTDPYFRIKEARMKKRHVNIRKSISQVAPILAGLPGIQSAFWTGCFSPALILTAAN